MVAVFCAEFCELWLLPHGLELIVCTANQYNNNLKKRLTMLLCVPHWCVPHLLLSACQWSTSISIILVVECTWSLSIHWSHYSACWVFLVSNRANFSCLNYSHGDQFTQRHHFSMYCFLRVLVKCPIMSNCIVAGVISIDMGVLVWAKSKSNSQTKIIELGLRNWSSLPPMIRLGLVYMDHMNKVHTKVENTMLMLVLMG